MDISVFKTIGESYRVVILFLVNLICSGGVVLNTLNIFVLYKLNFGRNAFKIVLFWIQFSDMVVSLSHILIEGFKIILEYFDETPEENRYFLVVKKYVFYTFYSGNM